MRPAIEVEKLLSEAVLSRAAGAARAGRYRDAAALLDSFPAGEDASARVIDLRARILAQQGRLAEAGQLWQEAVALDPREAAYRDALSRIARIERRAARMAGGWKVWFATALGAVAVLLAGLFALEWRLERFRAALHSDVERILSAKPAPSQAPRGARPPDLRIAVAGVTVTEERDALVLRFDSGLFGSGTRLTSSARQTLDALARQLEPQAALILLTVVGHADPEPLPHGAVFSDNSALALARAAVVANSLRGSAHLPSDMVLAQGLGDQGAPYPNDSRENRLKNRTVVVTIQRRPLPAP
jgi:type VI secretion system protein ImpK